MVYIPILDSQQYRPAGTGSSSNNTISISHMSSTAQLNHTTVTSTANAAQVAPKNTSFIQLLPISQLQPPPLTPVSHGSLTVHCLPAATSASVSAPQTQIPISTLAQQPPLPPLQPQLPPPPLQEQCLPAATSATSSVPPSQITISTLNDQPPQQQQQPPKNLYFIQSNSPASTSSSGPPPLTLAVYPRMPALVQPPTVPATATVTNIDPIADTADDAEAPASTSCATTQSQSVDHSNSASASTSSSGASTPTSGTAGDNVSPAVLDSNLTDSLASALDDSECPLPMPPLLRKPTDARSHDGSEPFTPSEAGPASRLLMDGTERVAGNIRRIVLDLLDELSTGAETEVGVERCPEARIVQLQLEIERMRHAHAAEVTQLRANNERILSEMQRNMTAERQRITSDCRRQAEQQRTREIAEVKRRQWCVFCSREAQFFCCWNTSYCRYSCQKLHWPSHMPFCAQAERLRALMAAALKSGEVPDGSQQLALPHLLHPLELHMYDMATMSAAVAANMDVANLDVATATGLVRPLHHNDDDSPPPAPSRLARIVSVFVICRMSRSFH